MAASPHPAEVAEWMGMDTAVEGILLATAGVESGRQPVPRSDTSAGR